MNCLQCGNELSTGDAPNSALCWRCAQKRAAAVSTVLDASDARSGRRGVMGQCRTLAYARLINPVVNGILHDGGTLEDVVCALVNVNDGLTNQLGKLASVQPMIVPVAPTTAAVDVEMVRVPNSEVARLIAVAAVLDDKWPESVRGMVNHLSPAMLDRIREVGMRLIGLADGVERRERLGL